MGTETISISEFSLALYALNVKLNNPLMGTETDDVNRRSAKRRIQEVKLNNPLMGTETLFCKTILPPIYKIVKLNNPLMGTETPNRDPTYIIIEMIKLN